MPSCRGAVGGMGGMGSHSFVHVWRTRGARDTFFWIHRPQRNEMSKQRSFADPRIVPCVAPVVHFKKRHGEGGTITEEGVAGLLICQSDAQCRFFWEPTAYDRSQSWVMHPGAQGNRRCEWKQYTQVQRSQGGRLRAHMYPTDAMLRE